MKKDWKYHLKRAEKYLYKTQEELKYSIYNAALEKGFSEEEADKFDADFASGTETIVKYKWEGEFNDIDICGFIEMTKEEICKKFNINEKD